MARTLNTEETLGRRGGVIHLLAELEGEDRIVSTLDYHHGSPDLFQFGNRVELRVNEKAQAGEKPEHLAGRSRRRRKRCFEDERTYFVMGSDIGGYGRP